MASRHRNDLLIGESVQLRSCAVAGTTDARRRTPLTGIALTYPSLHGRSTAVVDNGHMRQQEFLGYTLRECSERLTKSEDGLDLPGLLDSDNT
jgi:hypothetical protein